METQMKQYKVVKEFKTKSIQDDTILTHPKGINISEELLTMNDICFLLINDFIELIPEVKMEVIKGNISTVYENLKPFGTADNNPDLELILIPNPPDFLFKLLKQIEAGETRKYFMSLDGISALKNRTEHLNGYNIKATKYENEGVYCEVLIIPISESEVEK